MSTPRRSTSMSSAPAACTASVWRTMWRSKCLTTRARSAIGSARPTPVFAFIIQKTRGAGRGGARAAQRGEGGPPDRRVVAFAAAAGEDDVAGPGAEALGYRAAGSLQRLARLSPLEVDAGRVAPDVAQIGEHRVEDARVEGRRRRVVEGDAPWVLHRSRLGAG